MNQQGVEKLISLLKPLFDYNPYVSLMSKVTPLLELFYDKNNEYEICLDEVGRGCLFGRAYIACVVLPKDGSFDGKDIKDSKKFTSKKKIKAVSDYIKSAALFWHIEYVEAGVIDEINILQAVMRGMHACIRAIIEKTGASPSTMAVVDGNYFKPFIYYDDVNQAILELPAVTVEKGDAKYMGIAAASILAKVARDEYVQELCALNPELVTYYGLDTNVGYGTKKHMEGIVEHGITKWHRKSFAPCKNIKVK